MSSYKVDYSDLVNALQKGEEKRANELLEGLLQRLQTYVEVTQSANPKDAEEAVHRAWASVQPKIMQDKIREKRSLYKYLMKSCRHAYIHMAQHRVRFVEGGDHLVDPGRQIERLLDEERQHILETCLQKLPPQKRSYITYILNHPGMSTKALSTHFGISASNVRVKKSRIMRDLSQCVKKNWER